MVRIAVCDDKMDFATQITHLLKTWEGASEPLVVETFNNGNALLNAHRCSPFDIILLDIVMPGLTGMEVARELRSHDRSVKIVFLTSSPEFAIESYSVKASNYLLKPVQATQLYECISDLVSDMGEDKKLITIKSGGVHYRVSLYDIEYVEAQNKYVQYVLSSGHVITALDTLQNCEKQLDAGFFFKCHRSYIVNLLFVDSFSAKELVTWSGAHIPVSRNVQKEFESAYFAVTFEMAGDKI